MAALRKAGCSVQSLASIGKGCPDLMVGRLGHTTLLEVKDVAGGRAKGDPARDLTELEAVWLASWRGGRVHVVYSPAEALAAVGHVHVDDLPACAEDTNETDLPASGRGGG